MVQLAFVYSNCWFSNSLKGIKKHFFQSGFIWYSVFFIDLHPEFTSEYGEKPRSMLTFRDEPITNSGRLYAISIHEYICYVYC